MRQDILDYIRRLNLGTYKISAELPFNSADTPLYIKNPKTIYVDVAQIDSVPLITALNGLSIREQSTTVSVSFSSDAKQLPSNYESVIEQIQSARQLNPDNTFNRSEVALQTEYINDLLITVIDIKYITIR